MFSSWSSAEALVPQSGFVAVIPAMAHGERTRGMTQIRPNIGAQRFCSSCQPIQLKCFWPLFKLFLPPPRKRFRAARGRQFFSMRALSVKFLTPRPDFWRVKIPPKMQSNSSR
jgi:hypothetical protein